MDISVKKLSEILKIDPQVLLDKMIAAGLSQTSIEDSVSNEDKQKLISFIRSSKDLAVDDKPKAVVPAPQAQKKAPKTHKTKKSKDSSERMKQEKNKRSEIAAASAYQDKKGKGINNKKEKGSIKSNNSIKTPCITITIT